MLPAEPLPGVEGPHQVDPPLPGLHQLKEGGLPAGHRPDELRDVAVAEERPWAPAEVAQGQGVQETVKELGEHDGPDLDGVQALGVLGEIGDAQAPGDVSLGGGDPVVLRGHVIRPKGVDRVHQSLARFYPGHVGREGLVLDLHGQFPAPFAPLRDGPGIAVGQDVAHALPADDHLQKLQGRLAVAEPEIKAAGLLLSDDPPLEAFHGKGDHPAGADRVQGVLVAYLVGLADDRQVADPQVGAEHAEGFVFRSAVDALDPKGLIRLHHPLAADHAGVAGLVSGQEGLAQLLAVDLVGQLELAGLEVAGDDVAQAFQVFDGHGGAVFLKALVHLRFLEGGGPFLGHLLDAVLVVEGVSPLAPDGDGLEVLGAHDRAHAGPPAEVAQTAGDAGVPDQVFASRPDLDDLDLLVPQLLADQLLGLAGDPAPEGGGVLDLGLALVYPEIDRGLGLALDDDGVEAGVLQLGRPVPAALGVAHGPGQGRGGGDVEPADPADRSAGGHAGGEDQDVIRREGVHPWFGPLEEVVGSQKPAAQIGPVKRLGRLLDLGLVSGQVHVQYLAVVA